MSTSRIGGTNLVPTLTAVAVATITTIWLWRRLKTSVLGKIVVTELIVYPVKSCAGTSVDTATPTKRGFQGDRIAQVTTADGKSCTPRDKGQERLFHVQAEIWGNSLVLKSSQEASHTIDLDAGTHPTVQVQVLENPQKVTLRDYGDATAACSKLPRTFQVVVSPPWDPNLNDQLKSIRRKATPFLLRTPPCPWRTRLPIYSSMRRPSTT